MRYVLQGRVQSSPDRIRVNVQLFDGRDGRSVWGNTFESERTARDLFDLQDELTQQVVNEIAGSYGALARAELAERTAQASGEPRESRLRVPRLRLPAEPHPRDAPGGPRLSGAGRRGRARLRRWPGPGWPTSMPTSSITAGTSPTASTIRACARCGSPSGRCRSTTATSWRTPTWEWRLCSPEMTERGIAEMRRAVELNPNNPIVLSRCSSNYLALRGRVRDGGPRWPRRAIELVPHPPEYADFPLFVDHYVHGRYEQALVHSKGGVVGNDGLPRAAVPRRHAGTARPRRGGRPSARRVRASCGASCARRQAVTASTSTCSAVS